MNLKEFKELSPDMKSAIDTLCKDSKKPLGKLCVEVVRGDIPVWTDNMFKYYTVNRNENENETKET